jgi:hypothetical protein
VIAKDTVGDGDEVSGVSDVEKTVVVVFVVGAIRGEIDVIDPDVGCVLDGYGVAADDFANGEVADYDVILVLYSECEAREF